MTGFVLLQPLYLLGLAGVAAPIIIHLYGRRRRREVRFPSLQLLKATQQRQRSLVRLRSLIVLLLRILGIICFVLALARPTARPARWASGVIPSPASVAVVLDDSLSMALGTATAFGRARDAADAILAALRGGDDAAVVLTSGSEAHLPARLTRDVASLRRGLQALQPSQRAAGVSSAMASASELLAQSGRPTRRIYVVSDLQAASWKSVHVSPATAKLTATVVDVGVTGAENWAIQEVTVTSLVAFANRPVRLRADIRRHGGKVEKRAAVWLGDREPDPGAARTLALPPDGRGSVEFVYRPSEAGDVGLTIRLQGDDLAPDNERHVAVHVRDSLEVLCVEGTP
ncbi:MAG: BatA and WFA domain-containing protein, partial [Armatimonadota bacterium]